MGFFSQLKKSASSKIKSTIAEKKEDYKRAEELRKIEREASFKAAKKQAARVGSQTEKFKADQKLKALKTTKSQMGGFTSYSSNVSGKTSSFLGVGSSMPTLDSPETKIYRKRKTKGKTKGKKRKMKRRLSTPMRREPENPISGLRGLL